jgi:hypothetical protein
MFWLTIICPMQVIVIETFSSIFEILDFPFKHDFLPRRMNVVIESEKLTIYQIPGFRL